MIQTRKLLTYEAELVEADISRESRTATLHFLSPSANNDAIVVTIPLDQFGRFHRGIAERLRKEPALFDRQSRPSESP